MNQERWTGFKFRNRRYKGTGRNQSVLAPVFTALALTVFKDLTSGNSKLLSLVRNLFITGSTDKKVDKQILDADYKVLEEEVSTEK